MSVNGLKLWFLRLKFQLTKNNQAFVEVNVTAGHRKLQCFDFCRVFILPETCLLFNLNFSCSEI